MFILEVIPLTPLPPNVPQILSYFFDRELPRGVVVEVPINKRKVPAVVTSSAPLEKQKIVFKKSSFQLKKVECVVSGSPQVNAHQFRVALWLTKNYYSPLGLSLKTILPKFFLKKASRLFDAPVKKENQEKPIYIFSRAKEEIDNLKSYINRAVKREQQVLIILPEITTANFYHQKLSSEYKIVLYYSGLGSKKESQIWNDVNQGKVKVIISTRLGLFLPFKNLGLIVMEDPDNVAYKSDRSPKYWTRLLTEFTSNTLGSNLILISPEANIESHFKIKNKEYEFTNVGTDKKNLEIVDMAEHVKSAVHSIFSKELQDEIIQKIKDRKRTLIFSARRGYSGILLCENCGTVVYCPHCSAPMRIHKTTELVLVCHHCSYAQKFPSYCHNCNSYKLKPSGPPGSQKIFEQIRYLIEQAGLSPMPILILDSDVARNATEEEEIISAIQRERPAILIATQMIFTYRHQLDFDLVGITSADALYSSPDYKSEEELFYQMDKLQDFNPSKIIIQAFASNHENLQRAATGNFEDFYNQEIELRKSLLYPPFTRLAKLSYTHKHQNRAALAARILNEKLKRAVIQFKLGDKVQVIGPSAAFVAKEKDIYRYNIVLKIINSEDTGQLLKFVPPQWTIDIDPQDLL